MFDDIRQKVPNRGAAIFAYGVTLLATLLTPATSWAAAYSDGSSQSWVIATIVAVLLVSGLWLATITLLRAAVRMRWIARDGVSGLQRNLHVIFSGLLLLAIVIPYLAAVNPLAAMLTAGGIVAGAVISMLLKRPRAENRVEGSLRD